MRSRTEFSSAPGDTETLLFLLAAFGGKGFECGNRVRRFVVIRFRRKRQCGFGGGFRVGRGRRGPLEYFFGGLGAGLRREFDFDVLGDKSLPVGG